ncbi:hypothetical protein OSB04_002385 [Centaurea solstitialis]|uniref:Uncharacterized protein n=1 Tax=Centaurea solstitialis TaxID=347529 RepID=A0AA38WUU6_9ASTR|nr:hypothetical protein OSB04_002385 [Centaurea solstitialis]
MLNSYSTRIETEDIELQSRGSLEIKNTFFCHRFLLFSSSLPLDLVETDSQHSKTIHIDIRYHFIKDNVEKGNIEMFFVQTDYQLADLFTKPLDEKHFNFLIITEAYRSRKLIVDVQSVDCFLEDVCLILFVISNPKGEIVGCKIGLYPRSQVGAQTEDKGKVKVDYKVKNLNLELQMPVMQRMSKRKHDVAVVVESENEKEVEKEKEAEKEKEPEQEKEIEKEKEAEEEKQKENDAKKKKSIAHKKSAKKAKLVHDSAGSEIIDWDSQGKDDQISWVIESK